MLGEHIDEAELPELVHEVLAETGNIILNGCLATMANMLHETLAMSLPELVYGDSAELFELRDLPDEDGLVLFLYINFSIRERDIRGYIAMLMDLPSLASLRSLIGGFIARVMTDDAGLGA